VALAVNDRDGSLWYLERGFGAQTGRVVRVQASAASMPVASPGLFSTKAIARQRDVEGVFA
jgi:hypothetical protein